MALFWLCLAVACSDSFLPPSAVVDLRVIGARIDVQGAPERANPSPGDPIQASIFVVAPGALPSEQEGVPALTPPLLNWAFVACVPTATTLGPPVCGTLIEPCEGCIGPPQSDPFAYPIIDFTVPSEEELDADARAVLLQGVVCSNGTPSPEAILQFLSGETDDLVACEGPPIDEREPIEGRFVTIQIPIERDPEDPNLNPGIANISLNGSGGWPPPYAQEVPRTAPRTGCKSELDMLTEEERAMHPVAGSDPSSINLSVTAGSLQSFTINDVEVTEEIQVSWLADGGGFEVSFSFITEPASSILTQWQPSSEAPEDGRLVRFNFVIRDGRGGLERVERGLCVLPPPPDESQP